MSPAFEALLNREWLREQSVSRETVAEVLARVVAAAPDPVPRVDIADGTMLTGAPRLPHVSVSRASNVLIRLNLLQELGAAAGRPGRPVIPLRLSPEWALAGVQIRQSDGRPVEAVGALIALDGTPIGTPVAEKVFVPGDDTELLDTVASVVEQLRKLAPGRLLGLGVGFADPSFSRTAAERQAVLFRDALTRRLGMPAVVETAVNARAVLAAWRRDPNSKKLKFPQPHLAVVGVFSDWVSGTLLIDRKIHRGSRGSAGGIGHLTVDYTRPRGGHAPAPRAPGFDDPCSCGRAYGHVATLATPARIAGEVGMAFETAACQPRSGGSPVTAAFATAGDALGRGVSAVLDIADPEQLLLLLPAALANAEDGTAAAAYKVALANAVGMYSAAAGLGSQPPLIIEAMDPDDDARGARAAAACVLDSFIAYARGDRQSGR